MIAFIEDHRGVFGVEPICRVLPIAPSTYHQHVLEAREPDRASARSKTDAALRVEIARVWEENRQLYGARKIWRALHREGLDVARCTVERLMKAMGLEGVVRGRKIVTTNPDAARPCPDDKVNRAFQAERPNQLWVSDFTYVPTWSGKAYVAFVIDVFARRIVGWRGSTSMSTQFVLDALNQAIFQRKTHRDRDLIHHSVSQFARASVDGRSDPHSDRPRTVSFPGPVDRPWRLAARFRLAGACDPRRA
jgi:transposase InsO family protein